MAKQPRGLGGVGAGRVLCLSAVLGITTDAGVHFTTERVSASPVKVVAASPLIFGGRAGCALPATLRNQQFAGPVRRFAPITANRFFTAYRLSDFTKSSYCNVA